MRINIAFPVLDEEKRLEKGIKTTLKFLDQHQIEDCVLTIVDNGSADSTPEICERLRAYDSRVRCIRLEQKGFGVAFQAAIADNDCDILGYMDVDLSTKLKHFLTVIKIFEKYPWVQIVKGNRLDRRSVIKGRKPLRELTSRGLDLLVRLAFGTSVRDTMCGFQFFRRETAEILAGISSTDPGWFYCAELLLRADRLGMPIREIPVVWEDDYNTSVHVGSTVKNYLERIAALRKDIRKMRY